jgi:predicted DNA-binding WGR domain protein
MLIEDASRFYPNHQSMILEARDPERNIARRYEIHQSQDLFDESIVEISWGRIGTRGQNRRYSFPEPAKAHQFVVGLLRRRGRAHKRIGVSYQVVRMTGARLDAC